MELFDYAGISIAMSVSMIKSKKKADYITKTVEEDGIFDALEELVSVEKLHFLVDVKRRKVLLRPLKPKSRRLAYQLFPEHAPKTITVALSKTDLL